MVLQKIIPVLLSIILTMVVSVLGVYRLSRAKVRVAELERELSLNLIQLDNLKHENMNLNLALLKSNEAIKSESEKGIALKVAYDKEIDLLKAQLNKDKERVKKLMVDDKTAQNMLNLINEELKDYIIYE